jgi:hypothetical protein
MPTTPGLHRVDCRTRRAMLTVTLVRIRIPSAAALALDQRGADAVPLDGQRVIGVSDIDLLRRVLGPTAL